MISWFSGRLLLLMVMFASAPSYALEQVTLQLKWKHAFQFAGYYVAKEKGYFSEVGLDVNILEAEADDNPTRLVLADKAQFGVGTSSLLLNRVKGEPVVALAVIFQQSPYAIYAAPNIQNIHELVGKRIMLEPQADELLAYLKKEGISPDRIKRIPHSYDAEGLMNGKADAISGYISNEPFYFQKARYPFQTFNPRSAGIDFYGDNLFTSEQELRAHPERVKAFRAASLRGWQYVKNHHDEVIDLILAKYAPHLSREFLDFESDQMVPLLQPNLIDIGYMNPHRWHDIANTYADLGLVPRNFSLDGFLYDATEPDYSWFYIGFTISLVITSVVLSIALYINRINVKLQSSEKDLRLTASKFEDTEKSLRESEGKYRLLTENSKEVIWTLCPYTLKFLYVSPAVFNLRGYTPEEIIAEAMDAALTPEGSAFIRAAILQDLSDIESGKRSLDTFRTDEVEQPCKDGSKIWTEVVTNYYLNKKTNQYEIRGVTRDITKRKLAETALRQSKDFKTAIMNSLSSQIAVLDRNGFIVDVNDAWRKFSIENSDQPDQPARNTHIGVNYLEICRACVGDSTEGAIQAEENIRNVIEGRLSAFNMEYPCHSPNEQRWFIMSVTPIDSELGGAVIVHTNITQRKQMEVQIRQLAFFDSLTNLPNRRMLADRLTQTMATSKRSNCYGALLFLDLDNFKPLNDTHGHVVGDLLLVEAANRLINCVREMDTVARLGGDEFVVILSELDMDKTAATSEARLVADKILAAISAPFLLEISQDGQPESTVEHRCTASIGVAMFRGHEGSQDDILKCADAAMYEAKEAGRSQVRFTNALTQ